MSVVVSQRDVGPCRKQLTIEVPAPAVEAETERVIQDLGTRVRIPGFRKGKVPKDLVRRRFAKDIEEEVKERLLPRYWRQAQAESSIDPLLPPQVDEVADLAPGAPLTFTATVEIRPQVELRNIRDFDLPDPQIEPGTMEVDETIEGFRRQAAEWVPVDRPAARGDRVSLEITALASEDHPEERTDPVQIEVGDPNVWEELTLAVSGLSVGQEETFTRRHEHPAHEEGGQPTVHEQRYQARVTAIEERDLPALDDAFVARVAPDLGTVDAFKEAVVRQLRQNRMEQRREERHKALLDQLRERHPLELPQGVVRQEVETLVRDYAEGLARRGVDIERAGMDWGRIGEEMVPLAERRVHARLLLDAISEAESVHVTEEEFEATLAALARAQGASTPALRRALDEDGRLATLRSQLRREKTIRHLLGEEPAPGSVPELSTES